MRTLIHLHMKRSMPHVAFVIAKVMNNLIWNAHICRTPRSWQLSKYCQKDLHI